jgi:hypothetical protein
MRRAEDDIPMPKLALKFFLTASALHRKHRRIDWYRAVAIVSTLTTIGLIALYLWQRGIAG